MCKEFVKRNLLNSVTGRNVALQDFINPSPRPKTELNGRQLFHIKGDNNILLVANANSPKTLEN